MLTESTVYAIEVISLSAIAVGKYEYVPSRQVPQWPRRRSWLAGSPELLETALLETMPF